MSLALEHLLSLLRVTHFWEIQPLKAIVEKTIIDLKLVRLETWSSSKWLLLALLPFTDKTFIVDPL